MNQILIFRNIDDSKKELKKIIKFFAIFIMIFGIVLIGEGVYRYIRSQYNQIEIETPVIVKTNTNNNTVLNIKSNKEMKLIKYYWKILSEDKTGRVTEQYLNGQKEANIELDTLNGTNELYVEIVDADGNSIKYDPITVTYTPSLEDDDFDYDAFANDVDDENWEELMANDKTNPKIKIESESGKIKLTATDNIKMSYITYKWNDEAENTITGLSEDEKMVQGNIDVPEGTNTLTVTAVDRAGNTETITKEIKGVRGPSISALKENGQIIINISDEEKITKIVYDFNGEEKTIDNINQKTYELKLDMVDGENYVILDAYRDEIKSTYKGKAKKE